MNEPDKKVIAVLGKGGTGKSVLTALLAAAYVRKYDCRVLTIDADPASSLPFVLGFKPDRTISELRHDLIYDDSIRSRLEFTETKALIKDCVKREENIHLLSMGRPEDAGCFCMVNDLLKYGIQMLAGEYAITIIDGEAGPEQINRRVLESVDTIIAVADASLRSLHTAADIRRIAEKNDATKHAHVHLVLNNIRKNRMKIVDYARDMGFCVKCVIPHDESISALDMSGKPLRHLPLSSISLEAVWRMINS
jgi:CO dehydrogenase maturation factor